MFVSFSVQKTNLFFALAAQATGIQSPSAFAGKTFEVGC